MALKLGITIGVCRAGKLAILYLVAAGVNLDFPSTEHAEPQVFFVLINIKRNRLMSRDVRWSRERRDPGSMPSPQMVRTDAAYTVEVAVSPLPICPQCKKTDTVFNPTKSIHPSRWSCKDCGIEWGYEAFPHTDKWESAMRRAKACSHANVHPADADTSTWVCDDCQTSFSSKP